MAEKPEDMTTRLAQLTDERATSMPRSKI